MKNVTIYLVVFSFVLIKPVLSQDTIVLQPGPEGKDAQVHSLVPETNYANHPGFKSMAWTHSGVPAQQRGLIGFDLSFIAPGSTILQARLDLFFKSYETNELEHYGDNASYLLRITEPWEEDEVVWNNQPAVSFEDAVILPTSTDPEQDYPDIDVTDLVQAMVSDPENNHGIMIRLVNEQYYRSMLFGSGDCEIPEKRPTLEIIYIGCLVPTVSFEYEITDLAVDFTGISPTALTWQWDFGDGDTSDVQNPQHIYGQPGFYQVCLTVEDTCYFTEYCEEIEICIAPPVASFDYSIEDLNVYFQDSSLVAGEYYWDLGDGYFSNLANPWHHYQEPGIYQVCLTVWNGCGSDSACEWIEVCSQPVSDFYFYIDDLTAYFEDQSIEADEYYWDFGDGYFSNLADPIHIYDTPDNYMVCLATLNECGTDTTCQMLYISTVGVPEIDDDIMIIYPNPARDEVFIKAGRPLEGIFRMLDLSGKEVIKQDLDYAVSGIYRVPIGQVKPGLYIVSIGKWFGKVMVMK